MYTQNTTVQSKNTISKKAGANLHAIRMEQEKKAPKKDDTKPAGNWNDKKSA